MPLMPADQIQNVLASPQKRGGRGELAEPTSPMSARYPSVWVSIEEICNGEWSIGGRS